MSETEQTPAADSTSPDPEQGEQQEQGKSFSQADLDEVAKKVRAEERRKATERYADYDALKAKAGESKTLEERLAALESENASVKTDAMRARIQAKFGVSDDDAALFLTGADEETLTAQAKRLAERESERIKNGNHVPREGANPRPADDDRRAFVRQLTGRG